MGSEVGEGAETSRSGDVWDRRSAAECGQYRDGYCPLSPAAMVALVALGSG